MKTEDKALKRIDAHYILHEIGHIVHLERGVFSTIKKLIVQPGNTIIEFISITRTKIVKPIVFLIIITLIYSITNKLLHFQDATVEKVIDYNAVTIIDNWFTVNLGYYNICLGVFVALFLNLFYYKSKYNLFEILVLMCYIIAIDMLLAAILGIFASFIAFDFMRTYIVICLVYTIYAIANFFGKTKWYNYFIALFSFLTGMIALTFFPDVVGFMINYIVKILK